MTKARKVYIPGSQPPPTEISVTKGRPKKRVSRGRPKKNISQNRFDRRSNYRSKFELSALNEALSAVESGMPVKTAAREFNVPRTTLQRRAKGKNSDKLGGPTVLSTDEEKEIVARLILFGEWGYPLTTLDLRNMVKSYLDTLGKASRILFGQYHSLHLVP